MLRVDKHDTSIENQNPKIRRKKIDKRVGSRSRVRNAVTTGISTAVLAALGFAYLKYIGATEVEFEKAIILFGLGGAIVGAIDNGSIRQIDLIKDLSDQLENNALLQSEQRDEQLKDLVGANQKNFSTSDLTKPAEKYSPGNAQNLRKSHSHNPLPVSALSSESDDEQSANTVTYKAMMTVKAKTLWSQNPSQTSLSSKILLALRQDIQPGQNNIEKRQADKIREAMLIERQKKYEDILRERDAAEDKAYKHDLVISTGEKMAGAILGFGLFMVLKNDSGVSGTDVLAAAAAAGVGAAAWETLRHKVEI